MSLNKVLQPCDSYSIAGKVFILGEYAVLAGLPALVGALAPRFKLFVPDLGREPQSFQTFHPDSPLGRLQAWAKKMGLPDLKFQFEDPFHGQGGFGASTAQFGMAYLAYAQRSDGLERDWIRVWRLYQDLMGSEKSRLVGPSGADLVSQWLGGVICFDPLRREQGPYSADFPHYQDLWSTLDWSQLVVFSATGQPGRKVATHEHLGTFLGAHSNLAAQLELPLRQGLAAIQCQGFSSLGQAMDDYAEVLYQAKLEIPATTEDRKALRKLPGVLGVKGTGAMQSDGILVLVEPGGFASGIGGAAQSTADQMIEVATSRGLRLVSRGLTCQMGVTCLRSE